MLRKDNVRSIIQRSLNTLGVWLFVFCLVAVTGLAQGSDECVDPLWESMPGDFQVKLSSTTIGFPGEQVTGSVTINRLAIPEYLLAYLTEDRRLGLFIQADIQPPEVAVFEGTGTPNLTHRADLYAIKGGTYQFRFQLIGRRPGAINILFGWKLKILTEGACSVAINGVYIGCAVAGAVDSPEYKQCVCDTMGDMPAPGSWACRIHPLTFRAAWALWGCAGASPY